MNILMMGKNGKGLARAALNTLNMRFYDLYQVDDNEYLTLIYISETPADHRKMMAYRLQIPYKKFRNLGIEIKENDEEGNDDESVEPGHERSGGSGDLEDFYQGQREGRKKRNQDRGLANFPKEFWGDCILHAVYIINRLPSVALNNKVPYQVLFNKMPQYQHLRVFGCLTFAAIPSCHRDKLSPRARKCIFLGFAKGVKGYKLLDINTREVFLSRDVSVYEDVFPFQTSQDTQPSNLVLPAETISYLATDEHIPVSDPPGVQSMEPEQTNEPANAESNPTHQPRRSARTRIQLAYLNDYTCQNAAARRTSPHEISKFMSYDSLSAGYKVFAANMRRTQYAEQQPQIQLLLEARLENRNGRGPAHPVSPLLALEVAAALRRVRIRALHQRRQRLHAAVPQAPRSRNVDIRGRSMARTPPPEKTRTRRRRAPAPRPPWR
nr:Retrovirus-related Pol polyprotein from transposon TNT 1-94 [Ipomoea batatas]